MDGLAEGVAVPEEGGSDGVVEGGDVLDEGGKDGLAEGGELTGDLAGKGGRLMGVWSLEGGGNMGGTHRACANTLARTITESMKLAMAALAAIREMNTRRLRRVSMKACNCL
ncbi:hypothetical protein MLD38_009397 [Melastoma candidum]|uniref:Uncharacterized protein n=1 Tax=Melastoma candidum TaxID=119954 RepID=A0ACB9RX43_9MYRT|nr:hypothetical protein MLD38_009397 [Melastoma candidum]